MFLMWDGGLKSHLLSLLFPLANLGYAPSMTQLTAMTALLICVIPNTFSSAFLLDPTCLWRLCCLPALQLPGLLMVTVRSPSFQER